MARQLAAFLIRVLIVDRFVGLYLTQAQKWPDFQWNAPPTNNGDFFDLSNDPYYTSKVIGGSISIMFKVTLGTMGSESFIFSLDNGVDKDTISISLDNNGFKFIKISDSSGNPSLVKSPYTFQQGITLHVLVTITSAGQVSVYQGGNAAPAVPATCTVPAMTARSRITIGGSPGGTNLFLGILDFVAIWNEVVSWQDANLYLTTTTTQTTSAPSPCLLSQSQSISLMVETSWMPNAETRTGATVSFFTSGAWTNEKSFCHNATHGEIINATFFLQDWPQRLRLTAHGDDSWGIRQIWMRVECTNATVAVLTPANLTYTASSKYWIDGSALASSNLGAQVYSIPLPSCPSRNGILNAAPVPCIEGPSVNHGGTCTPACLNGFSSSTSKFDCLWGIFLPTATFSCIANSCAPLTAPPQHGGFGDCSRISQLPSGQSCQPVCDPLYIPSGPTSCFRGNLNKTLCVPEPCNMTQTSAGLGTCPADILPSGQSCQLQCKTGFIGGSMNCSFGVLNVIPCKIQFMIRAVTSNDTFAGTTTGATVAFLMNSQWSPEYTMCTTAARGDIVTKHFALPVWPVLLRITGSSDAWGSRDISINLDGYQQQVVPISNFNGMFGDGPDAYKQTTFSIPPMSCSVTMLQNGASCVEGAVIPHGRNCTTKCSSGSTPFPISLSCRINKLFPQSYTCSENPCDALAPLDALGMDFYGSFGNCTRDLPSRQWCHYSCNVGYVLAGRTECLRGNLSSTALCMPMSCDASVPPHHGNQGTCPHSLPSGGSCRHSCQIGYMPLGSTTCLLGNLTLTECVPASCNVALPEYSDMGTCHATLASGLTCQPECQEGFSLVGETSCLFGSLNSSYCVPDPCNTTDPEIRFGGRGTCPEMLQSGASCDIQCDPGYKVSGHTFCYRGNLTQAVCLVHFKLIVETCDTQYAASNDAASSSFEVDGKWTPQRRFQGPVIRGQIVHQEFRFAAWPTSLRLTPLDTDDGWGLREISLKVNGVTVTVLGRHASCSFARRLQNLRGSPYWLKKSADGGGTRTYTVPLPACDLNRTLKLASSQSCNGGHTLVSGRQCHYQCVPGYSPTSKSFACYLGALLPNTACVETHCPVSVPQNGRQGDCPAVLQPGENCTLECDMGYKPSSVVHCSTGVATPAFCQQTHCNVSQPPAHGGLGTCGDVPWGLLPPGQACHPSCERGYWLNQSAVCTQLVELIDAVCAPKNCSAIVAPRNGTLGNCSVLQSGTTCQMLCNPGYTGNVVASCHLGTLTTSGTCRPSPCPIPNVANGTRGDCPTMLGSGSECSLSCNNGYQLANASRKTRCSFGKLTLNGCVAKPCQVSVLLHGNLGNCPQVLQSGGTCQPACDPGYKASGVVSCSLGVLNTARCSAAYCNLTTLPKNSTRGDCNATLASGRTCQPICDTGYDANGPTFCYLGNLRPTLCLGRPCAVQVLPSRSTRGNCPTDFLQHGTSCQPKCDVGYVASGPTTCVAAQLQLTVCSPRSCDIFQPPENAANLGDCAVGNSTVLASGSSCHPVCSSGFRLERGYFCDKGTLRDASCTPDETLWEQSIPYAIVGGSSFVVAACLIMCLCLWFRHRKKQAEQLMMSLAEVREHQSLDSERHNSELERQQGVIEQLRLRIEELSLHEERRNRMLALPDVDAEETARGDVRVLRLASHGQAPGPVVLGSEEAIDTSDIVCDIDATAVDGYSEFADERNGCFSGSWS